MMRRCDPKIALCQWTGFEWEPIDDEDGNIRYVHEDTDGKIVEGEDQGE